MGMFKRNFIHDCDKCQFHGSLKGHDVYTCNDTIIMRYGDDGPEYRALDVELAKKASRGNIFRDALRFAGIE